MLKCFETVKKNTQNTSSLAKMFKDCCLYMKTKMWWLGKAKNLKPLAFQAWIAFSLLATSYSPPREGLLVCEYHC